MKIICIVNKKMSHYCCSYDEFSFQNYIVLHVSLKVNVLCKNRNSDLSILFLISLRFMFNFNIKDFFKVFSNQG